jgi:hypothetical protein
MIKRIIAVLALVAGLSGIFAATAAPPASAAVCLHVTVTVFGNRVVPTTHICVPPG